MGLKSVFGQIKAMPLMRREMSAFLPALGLAFYWYGVAGFVLVLLTAFAVAWLARGTLQAPLPQRVAALDHETLLPLRPTALLALDAALEQTAATNRSTAVFVIGLDQAESLRQRRNPAEHSQILRRIGERLHDALRENDTVARLEGDRFAVVLGSVRRADLESAIQIAARLQSTAEAPLSVQSAGLYLTAHVGFCLVRQAPQRSGEAMLKAAELAANAARNAGPSSIRAYSIEIQNAALSQAKLTSEVEDALEGGQIIPHFMPQISSDTGEISGFAAVACWLHPKRGYLGQTALMPAIEAAGLSGRLTEVLLYHGFSALRGWTRAGLPQVTLSLPLSREELRDPKLADRLKWELDRFEVDPIRLRLEVADVTETTHNHDTITHTIAALAQLGCPIALAGFGHGPTSIAHIHKSAVRRLHVDRSFVAHVDREPEQQKVVAAILSMAEQLGMETLADGVATIGEHAMLAQLGCTHVQGPAIARAMAYEDTLEWSDRHRAKLGATPKLNRRPG